MSFLYWDLTGLWLRTWEGTWILTNYCSGVLRVLKDINSSHELSLPQSKQPLIVLISRPNEPSTQAITFQLLSEHTPAPFTTHVAPPSPLCPLFSVSFCWVYRTYAAMETLTEPHTLTATLSCMIGMARSLVSPNNHYPEGRAHVLPLLMGSLPGVDPNDFSKCMVSNGCVD